LELEMRRTRDSLDDNSADQEVKAMQSLVGELHRQFESMQAQFAESKGDVSDAKSQLCAFALQLSSLYNLVATLSSTGLGVVRRCPAQVQSLGAATTSDRFRMPSCGTHASQFVCASRAASMRSVSAPGVQGLLQRINCNNLQMLEHCCTESMLSVLPAVHGHLNAMAPPLPVASGVVQHAPLSASVAV